MAVKLFFLFTILLHLFISATCLTKTTSPRTTLGPELPFCPWTTRDVLGPFYCPGRPEEGEPCPEDVLLLIFAKHT